jgi:DNA polymerase/3'-5' exonuclease PolX
MNHHEAVQAAWKLGKAIKPHCEYMAIAGSIRRNKQEGIKDIELVVVPTWQNCTDPSDMFGERTVAVNFLHEWAMRPDCPVQWIKTGTPEVIPWQPKAEGKYWRGIVKESGVKLDLFLACRENFGAVFLIRTGSAAFSQEVVTHALRVGYKFRDGHLWAGERHIPVGSEEDVFRHLGLEYVEPCDRVDERAVRSIRAQTAQGAK